jgi:hypothetical protein
VGVLSEEKYTSKTTPEEIAKKMGSDKEYTSKIIYNYDYAKDEFKKAGVDLDQTTHQKMAHGYQVLEQSAKKVFTKRAGGEVVVSVGIKF